MKATSLLCVALLVANTTPLAAAVIRVEQGGSGQFTTIREGIDAAGDGDTVLVWPGTYSGPLNRGLDFGGRSIVVRSLKGRDTVTIDCGGEDRAFYLHAWENTTSVIDGFTITRGLGDDGGAIYCRYASPRITNLTLIQNRADRFGGAIRLDRSAAVIRHVAFVENSAGNRGGAISMNGSSPVVLDAGFKGNVGRVAGGALHLSCSSPAFRDCRFYSNRAALGAGGVGCDILGSAQFVRCLFHRSTAPEFGGAFFMEGASPLFVECRFYENEAREGGAVKLMQCAARFDACEFVGNAAANEGGGVHAEMEGSVELYGCLLDRNTSGVGGALRVERASLTLGCCLFTDNVSSLAGGAISCWGNTEATIEGCTFSENRGGYLGGAIYAAGHASVDVMGCTFAENAAAAGGGLVCDGTASATVVNTIVAFSSEGDAVHCEQEGSVTLSCCDVFGNAGGDWVGCIASQEGTRGNACEDPLFCLDQNPEEPYSLRNDSYCSSQNNTICGQIGASDVGCVGTLVRPTSWGAIKAAFR